MPDTPLFDLASYCNDPNYPAQLEVGLYSNQPDLAAGVRLSDLVECTFAGYRRLTGDLWAQRLSAAQGGPLLRSKSLTWVCREASPGAVAAGAFVVAVMGGARQFIGLKSFRGQRPVSSIGQAVACQIVLADFSRYTVARASS